MKEYLNRIRAFLDYLTIKLFSRWYLVKYYNGGQKHFVDWVYLLGFSKGFIYENVNKYHPTYKIISIERAKNYGKKQKRKVR